MISVPEVVENIIKQSAFLEEGLNLNIINLSSYARFIQKRVATETKKPVKIGTIVMALARLSGKHQANKINIQKAFDKDTDITVRSNLFEATYPVQEDSLKKQELLFQKISSQKGVFLTITQGMYEITIIASEKIKKVVDSIYKQLKPITLTTGISSVTIHLSQQARDTQGVYYFLIKTLAFEGINIIEVVSTYTEFIIFLKNEDIARAFNLLQKALYFN